jgi:Uma2 family endonuclease
MAAATTKKRLLGPEDHGRAMTMEEFDQAIDGEGYRFELVDGRVYVSPVPNLPHEWVVHWLAKLLDTYSLSCPGVINYVSTAPRVFPVGRPGPTSLQPDIAAFRDFPTGRPYRQLNWRDVTPVLVVEVLSPDNPEKDYERNVALYPFVPSLQEYWILDALRPTLTLTAYRRAGRRWRKALAVPENGTYTTPLLPGFSLTVNAQP